MKKKDRIISRNFRVRAISTKKVRWNSNQIKENIPIRKSKVFLTSEQTREFREHFYA